jgi:hypothetical protein
MTGGSARPCGWISASPAGWAAWERAIGLIAGGSLPAEEIITHRQLPLAEWQEAFRLPEDRQTG